MPDRATPEPERKRGIPPRWRIAAAAALACLLLTAASPAFANSYSRGNWSCTDFKNMERSIDLNRKIFIFKEDMHDAL